MRTDTPPDLDYDNSGDSHGEDIAPPSVSCSIQNRRSARTAWRFDINAACSAFIFMFLIQPPPTYRRLQASVSFGAERLSRIVDWTDRSTCVIFGDGAARRT